MTQPPPFAPYAQLAQDPADIGHLKAIAICHYVVGGLMMVFSLIFVIYIVMGAMFVSGKVPMGPPPQQQFQIPAQPPIQPLPQLPGGVPGTTNYTMTVNAQPQPFPKEFGWIFIGMGSCGVACGWALGIINIISGRAIAKRKWRIFSLIVAGFNCMWFPIGTGLGVFTFIVLLRQSVTALYPPSKPA